ncbi:LuxR family transcriptional regulator [Agromyces sp. Marseille-P2726]|uniref:helix-turn-helix transcriptional regulator n=1 Tax=Agromyces sp. Marseille-P2726 TaxID=2709132 RepID=UPI00156D87BC|nr:LuxR family transcriptional regulator [Agromyces sp. Marseille-P2726]
MAVSPVPSVPIFVGREHELGTIRGLLDRSRAGEAQTLVVSGDAGIGKTALVARACSNDDTAMTIFGACLPLTSMSIPLLPIRTALRDLDEGLEEAGIVDLQGDDRDVTVRFDDWLARRCHVQPVVLVVDDVQWADRSALDALMYVIAGPARRRLTVIATLRAGEVGLGHPLQRWLADIRRLPRMFELRLEPFDRAGTAEQIEVLIGAAPHQSLIDDVQRRGRGNPYFTRLMVSGLTPDARVAPETFPVDLSSAVLQSWFRLSEETRRLATVLAVGGAASRADDLAEVVGEADVVAIRSALAEAVDSGTLDRLDDGSFWFHHPMSAEVLAAALADDERREWHRRFADLLEARIEEPAAVASVIAIADHRYRSGDTSAAFEWAIKGADSIDGAEGRAEQLRLLRRAVELLPDVPGVADADSLLDALLRRRRAVAADAGATFDELEAVEALLARLDPSAEPLAAAELMVRRMHLRFMAGDAFIELDEMREAIGLASADPKSSQYALALAELAHAELWAEAPGAAAHAREAIDVAREADDARALSHALAAASMAATYERDGALARAYGEEGVEAALASRDWFAYVHALLWEGNAVETWASDWFADRMREHRLELIARGGPPAYIAWVSANEAGALLAMGRTQECEERLRVALGSDAGPLGDVLARLTAARFAALRGNSVEAQSHLLRAEELFADGSAFLSFEFDAVRAEVRLAMGDPRGAYEAALAGATGGGSAPTMCEWLMPLAARALADLVQSARDTGRDVEDTLAVLDALVQRFPHVIRDVGEQSAHVERQIVAFEAMYAAEQARARGSENNATAWVDAAGACSEAGFPWEEAYSRWRAAEALLARGRGRQQGAEMLRSGLALARDLGARPVEDELVDLARRARVSIEEPPSAASDALSPLPGLTARGREILDLIAVGRTYGEIARTLVISEKTVSTHVSHLLAKTGTSSRVELARRVHRLGIEA